MSVIVETVTRIPLINTSHPLMVGVLTRAVYIPANTFLRSLDSSIFTMSPALT